MNPDDEIDAIPVDDLDPIEAAPKRTTAQSNAAWADSLSAIDRAEITARAAMPGASEADRARVLYLLGRHTDQALGVEDTAEPIVGRDERPTAGITGAAQGVSLGFADEAGGWMRSQATGRPYEVERDALRRMHEGAREQAPALTTMGELAGSAPYLLIPGGGATAAERVAIQGGIGAGLGTASGAGFSEGETAEEVARDAAAGGTLGVAFGAGGQLVGEGGRAALGQVSRAASGADRARVASIATGTSRELTDTLMREAASMPGGVSGVAERLRRLDVVPAAGTAQQVRQRAGEALDRVGHSGRLGEITEQLEQTAPVARERLLTALDRYAQSVESDPVMRRFGSAVRRRAEDFAETLPEQIGYRRAVEILRGIGDQTTWIDPVSGARPPQDVARGTYRSLRGELDDIAEEALGRGEAGGTYRDAQPGTASETPLEEYQRARLDTQAALFAQEWSDRALDRLARNRGISPSDYAAAMIGGGGDGSMVRAGMSAIANRSWRLREGTVRATAAEIAQRVLQSQPERLGRWAAPLMRALERGGTEFGAAHMALSSRDPEYRRAIEELQHESEEEQQ